MSRPGKTASDLLKSVQPEWLVTKAAHYCAPGGIIGQIHLHQNEYQVFKVIECRGLEGSKVLNIGKESFGAEAITEGLFWIPPGVRHWSEDLPESSPRMIELRFRRTSKDPNPFRPERFPYHLATDRFPEVLECLNSVIREMVRQKLHWEWTCSALVSALVALAARAQMSPPQLERVAGYRVETEGISKALNFIHENYFESIELKELARLSGMSVSRFSKLFTIVEGTTPIDYLIGFRLKKATDLITERDLALTQAAVTVGFSSLQHFSHCYKQRFGIAPSKALINRGR